MSGSQGQNLQQLITEFQTANKLTMQLIALFQKGVIVQNQAPVLTVATLPVAGAAGQFYWASNARKAGEGAGVGTGVMVYWNPATSTWFTFSGNVVVTS